MTLLRRRRRRRGGGRGESCEERNVSELRHTLPLNKDRFKPGVRIPVGCNIFYL
jgi:hypothetical protein